MNCILVTGTRSELSYGERNIVIESLASALVRGVHSIIVHGDCTTGVDAVVSSEFAGCNMLWLPANWAKYNRRAGPRRNAHMARIFAAMADSGYECHLLALPRGKQHSGTRQCMSTVADRMRREKLSYTMTVHEFEENASP